MKPPLNIIAICLALLTFVTSENSVAGEACKSGDMSWFFKGFERLGVKQKDILKCFQKMPGRNRNFERTLADYGACVAEIISGKASSGDVADYYNKLMGSCHQPQLFIARAFSPSSSANTVSPICYILVMNNWPSAIIPQLCIQIIFPEHKKITPFSEY